MSERTPNQTKTEEELARERAEFVEFQYGLWDLVLRLGTVLSSLVFFGGVLYLAGGLHAWAYFVGFSASWLVWELPGNSFPFRVLLPVLIFLPSIAAGARLIIYEGSKRKWSWVVNLISRHEPHKESMVGTSLLNLFLILASLVFILLRLLPFNYPWMITHPYWASVLSVLWAPVLVAWAAFFVLAPSKNDIRNFFTRFLLFPVVVLLSILVFPRLRPYIERSYTMIFMNLGGILFGAGVGARVVADLAHSNGGSLQKYSMPSPRGGWSAANAFPLYVAFLIWFPVFSFIDGLEQSLYDHIPSRSNLPIVMLEDKSCRQALLITSRHVYTVALQSSQPLDVVPISWEKISLIRAPLSGRCPTS